VRVSCKMYSSSFVQLSKAFSRSLFLHLCHAISAVLPPSCTSRSSRLDETRSHTIDNSNVKLSLGKIGTAARGKEGREARDERIVRLGLFKINRGNSRWGREAEMWAESRQIFSPNRINIRSTATLQCRPFQPRSAKKRKKEKKNRSSGFAKLRILASVGRWARLRSFFLSAILILSR